MGVAREWQAKESVLAALTRKFTLAPGTDLAVVARECPEAPTGADLYALCADAWMHAFKRTTAQVGHFHCSFCLHMCTMKG